MKVTDAIFLPIFDGVTISSSTVDLNLSSEAMSGSSLDRHAEKESRVSTFVADYSPEEIKKAHQVLYNEGLRMRIQVNGKEYVEKALQNNKDDFARPMQEVGATQPSGRVSLECCTDAIAVRSRSLLGLGLVTSRLRAEDSFFPEYRHAMLPEQSN